MTSTPKPTALNKIKIWFISGLLVSLPLILTIYIAISIIGFFDELIIAQLFPNSIVSKIPGIGIVASAVSMVILGFISSNFLGAFFLNIGNKILAKIPIISGIYSTFKQIFDTLLSNQSKAFKEVALIEYPRVGMWTLAFVTSTSTGEIQRKTNDEVVSVFVPTTPNPTSGFLLFVPKKDVIPLDMKPDVAMKLIISGGVIDEATSPKALSAPK